jgi:hypothetical protein
MLACLIDYMGKLMNLSRAQGEEHCNGPGAN